jgi:hypothetical protein
MVDLFVLSARAGPLRDDVRRAIEGQRGVRCRVYRVVGRRQDSDPNRYETIARARNHAKSLGTSSWAMFLDDDVALGSDCVLRLVTALEQLTEWGALAADYLHQSRDRRHVGHVSMGATLFRRSVLEKIRFRWEIGRCECRCCCEDLGKLGWRIGYLPGAAARHLARGESMSHSVAESQDESLRAPAPQILAALDANHFSLFHRFFLATYAATGNQLPITVFAYGMSPAQLHLLEGHPLVARVFARPPGSLSPAIRRVSDFQHVLAQWSPTTPVALWDAGDVLFQQRIDDLWETVRAHPTQLLAVREPATYPRNALLGVWAIRVPDHSLRREVFRVLANRPHFNSGFLAGSVSAFLPYLRFAERFLKVTRLARDPWSDQIALNWYCHSRPGRWAEIDERWNYCLAHRRPKILQRRRRHDADWDLRLANLPRFVTEQGKTIAVVHGNGSTLEGTLKQWWAMCPTTALPSLGL